MNLRIVKPLATFLLAISVFVAAARADDTFHRSLPVSSNPDLYVSTGAGNIHIYAGSSDKIEITGRIHVGWGAFGDIHSRVDHILANPPIEQSGNSVHVGDTGNRSLFNNISISYDISAPPNVALNLHSGSGDIEVDNVGRFLAASTGSGNVRAHQLHGPAQLDAGSGDLEIEETAAGNVKAKTGSGSIRVHGLDGTFYARSGSGDIEADGHLDPPSNIATGSGSVRLHLTSDSRFHLEASTGSGNLRVHLPGLTEANADSSRHHLTMSVNGGGGPLEIRTGSGDVELNAR